MSIKLDDDFYPDFLKYVYESNMLQTIYDRIQEGDVKVHNTKSFRKFYSKYVSSCINLVNAKNKIFKSLKDAYPSVTINDFRVDGYRTKLSLFIEYNSEEDLGPLFADGYKLDPNNDDIYLGPFVTYEMLIRLFYMDDIAKLKKVDKRFPTMQVTFQVTDDCNLRCTYCYQHNKGHNRMTFDTAKKAIDYLLTRSEDNCSYISRDKKFGISLEFIGGEGLLEIDLIDQILSYFIERCLDLDHPWLYYWTASIGSNGVLYFANNVQRILNKWDKALNVAITVDGNKQLHDMCRLFPDGSGSYDLAMAALRHQLENDKNPGTKITLSPDNLKYFEDSIIEFINNGLFHIWFNGIYEHTWTVEEANLYYNSLKNIIDYLFDNNLQSKIDIAIFSEGKYIPALPTENQNACGGNGSMLAISPNGEFYNCLRYMGSSLNGKQEPLRIGDIDSGIGSLSKDKQNIQCMQCITRRSQSTDECFYCPIAIGCSWCSGYCYELYGTPDKRTTSNCNFHKAEALANYYYWSRMYETENMPKRDLTLPDYEFFGGIIDVQEYKNLISRMERVMM